jgi:predicted PurR-regulated permease PerM
MAIFSRRSRYSWLFVVWVIIGIVIAWGHSYITVSLVKLVLSALLAIFLWPLVLLGISLHIH